MPATLQCRALPWKHRWRSVLSGRTGANSQAGAAIVEFCLVAILLLFLLLAIIQLAVYLHIRNVTVASAAEGARFAANADKDPEAGALRAHDLIGKAIGGSIADRLTCKAFLQDDPDSGLEIVRVSCAGNIPVFFAPIVDVLPIKVSARSVREGQ